MVKRFSDYLRLLLVGGIGGRDSARMTLIELTMFVVDTTVNIQRCSHSHGSLRSRFTFACRCRSASPRERTILNTPSSILTLQLIQNQLLIFLPLAGKLFTVHHAFAHFAFLFASWARGF